MSRGLSKRQLLGLRKAQAHKKRRLELKELQRQRLAESASRRVRPPRRKDWWDDDEHEMEQRERFSRRVRRSPQAWAPEPLPEAVGTVLEIRSGDSLVAHQGTILRAILPTVLADLDPSTRSPLAVGDRVQLEPIGRDRARIVAALPRRSALRRDVYDPSRRSPVHKSQVLAANIDQVIVVCSPAQPPFRPRLIDRYLVAASRDCLPAMVCLNKEDLGVPDEVAWHLNALSRLGVPVVRTSAVTGGGLVELKQRMAGKVSVLTGHSGVGKSSLLNALEPHLALRTGQVSLAAARQGKGRHTTSAARLLPLSLPETFVVDTPGIRAFGIRGMKAPELAGHFPDIAALASGCAYRGCLHQGEPDCAVAARTQHDGFLGKRLESYRAMLTELE